MSSRRSRLVVLASGSGTLLQALLDASADDEYPAEVIAVGSDRYDAFALTRAGALPTFVVPASTADWDGELTAALHAHDPALVVLAGFMRIVGPQLLARFADHVINSHPALLPAFPGADAVRDALAYGVHVTGATIHLVDAGVDTGPILAQEAVEIAPTDDDDVLHERIKIVERRLLVDTVRSFVTRPPVVEGRKVQR